MGLIVIFNDFQIDVQKWLFQAGSFSILVRLQTIVRPAAPVLLLRSATYLHRLLVLLILLAKPQEVRISSESYQTDTFPCEQRISRPHYYHSHRATSGLMLFFQFSYEYGILEKRWSNKMMSVKPFAIVFLYRLFNSRNARFLACRHCFLFIYLICSKHKYNNIIQQSHLM